MDSEALWDHGFQLVMYFQSCGVLQDPAGCNAHCCWQMVERSVSATQLITETLFLAIIIFVFKKNCWRSPLDQSGRWSLWANQWREILSLGWIISDCSCPAFLVGGKLVMMRKNLTTLSHIQQLYRQNVFHSTTFFFCLKSVSKIPIWKCQIQLHKCEGRYKFGSSDGHFQFRHPLLWLITEHRTKLLSNNRITVSDYNYSF